MKLNLQAVGKVAFAFLKRRSPEILTGLGIAGMGAAIVLAVKATPKAQEAIKNESRNVHDGDPDAYTKKEAFKWGWRYYGPAAALFAVSSGCIIFASRTNLQRNAELAAAYGVTKTALKEYKEAAKEVVGEKKEQQIHDKAAENLVEKSKIPESSVMLVDTTQALVYDQWSGRYFNINIEKLNRAIEDISYALRDQEFMILNEFYDLIGQERTAAGEILGWSADRGPIRPSHTSTLKNGKTPCLALGFSRDPTETYRDCAYASRY